MFQIIHLGYSFSPIHVYISIRALSLSSTRKRHPFNPIIMATQYTINDEVCPPIDERELRNLVQRHCSYLDDFLSKKPIASHTRNAFDQLKPLVDTSKKIILDSGCGTARSTVLLGEKYPDHIVIGIDRSFVRLNRNQLKSDTYDITLDRTSTEDSQRPFQAVSANVLLVRAELIDFWRCCLSEKWEISKHFIFYPNPYPKKARVKSRFYGHPAFPLILMLGGDITLRSNWKGYLKEFSNSVEYAHEYYMLQSDRLNPAGKYLDDARKGPIERLDKTFAWTNFEKKYDVIGELTYELILQPKSNY